MMERLRRKFILTNLVLVGLTLAAVFGVLVMFSARRLADESRAALQMAVEWREGELPPRFAFLKPEQEEGEEWRPMGRDPRQHMRSIVPVFVVEVRDGEVVSVNNGGQVEVSEEIAAQAVEEALEQGGEVGELSALGLRFQVDRKPDGDLRVAFADRSWETETLRTAVLACLLVWMMAMGGFFLISRVLASLALAPAERAWRQQRQFVADASHELKTPLTVILANTSIVLSHRESRVAEQAKWLEYTREEAQRMRGLVEDMLFLAKSDAAQEGVQVLSVCFSELVTAGMLSFEPVAFEAGVALEGDVTPELYVQGDEVGLRRLIMILLDNAVKYAGPQGEVGLTLSRQGNKVVLAAHNTGEAIPEEHLTHLFERFYRADPARSAAQGGYGLGLAIAKNIVEAHRGKISVSSAAGEGTCFTVVLPLA